jgi:hypothetical protein
MGIGTTRQPRFRLCSTRGGHSVVETSGVLFGHSVGGQAAAKYLEAAAASRSHAADRHPQGGGDLRIRGRRVGYQQTEQLLATRGEFVKSGPQGTGVVRSLAGRLRACCRLRSWPAFRCGGGLGGGLEEPKALASRGGGQPGSDMTRVPEAGKLLKRPKPRGPHDRRRVGRAEPVRAGHRPKERVEPVDQRLPRLRVAGGRSGRERSDLVAPRLRRGGGGAWRSPSPQQLLNGATLLGRSLGLACPRRQRPLNDGRADRCLG